MSEYYGISGGLGTANHETKGGTGAGLSVTAFDLPSLLLAF